MKIILNSINTQIIERLLWEIHAVKRDEEEIIMEYFDVKNAQTELWIMKNIPEEFRPLFLKLKMYVEDGTLESQGYYLTLVDKNEECFIVLHRISPKQNNILKAKISIQFHLYEWANVEDLLLEHGFQVYCHIEEKRISYYAKELQTEFIIVIPPFMPAFLEVKTKNDDQMVKALAEIGYSLDQAIHVEH